MTELPCEFSAHIGKKDTKTPFTFVSIITERHENFQWFFEKKHLSFIFFQSAHILMYTNKHFRNFRRKALAKSAEIPHTKRVII